MLTVSTNWILCYVLMIVLASRLRCPLNKWEWNLLVTCLGALLCWTINMHNSYYKVRCIWFKFLRRFIISDIFSIRRHIMMTSSNGNVLRISGPLREIHRSLVNSQHKGPDVSLVWVRISCKTNGRMTGNLRLHDVHVTSSTRRWGLYHTIPIHIVGRKTISTK